MAEEPINNPEPQDTPPAAEPPVSSSPPPATTDDMPPPLEAEPSDSLGWRNILPEQYREAGYVKAHGDLGSFMQQVDNLVRTQGRSIILPDNPEAPDYIEKVRAIYKRLGAPESPSDYALELPEGVPLNHAALEAFREAAASAGLNQQQADTIFKRQVESARKQSLQIEQTKAQMQQEMRQSWGKEVYEHKDARARDMARRMGLHDEFDQHGWFAHPQFVEAMADVADYYVSEGMMPGGVASGRSYDEVHKEILDLKRSDAYRNPGNPQYGETRRQVVQLENLRASLRQRR